ncbi:hypothetical protein R1sor_024610 [Riccia sorocarpa]|uniref:Uncharacterized protein n=1 Tax=Riccia sorocarpa TaxID=122646 RepID=A0ABD3GUZ5_9MARC
MGIAGNDWVLMKTRASGYQVLASSCHGGAYSGEEIYVPFKSLLPLVDPNDVILVGWDISSMNLAYAMARARVLDIDLQKQLRPYMQDMVPHYPASTTRISLPPIKVLGLITASRGLNWSSWSSSERTSGLCIVIQKPFDTWYIPDYFRWVWLCLSPKRWMTIPELHNLQ